MIPRYYDGTTGDKGNGIGALRDCISCTITEERNGSFELEMVYPVGGQHYDSLALRGLIKAKPNPFADEQLFRIYQISRPIGGQVTVNAAHISYDLSGIPVAPFAASGAQAALAGLKEHVATDCEFTFWSDVSTAGDFSVSVPSSLRSRLGGVEGSILDVFGGEYEWDNYTVKLHSERGTDRGVSIRYGKNLTDLTQEENCASIYTGVYPYWTDSDGNVVQISTGPVVNVPDGNYDFVRILTLDVSQDFEEQPTDEQLQQAALNYIKSNNVGVPEVSLKLSWAQLENTEEYKGKAVLERVGLCDTVRVTFARLGVQATAKVVKTVYNVLLDRYDSVELGDARATLADTVASLGKDTKQEIDRTQTMLKRAIARATKLITGNLGGYVVLHSSTGGDTPDEILIMDKPDINTATRVWRWNLSGLGYSSTGYNGEFGLAMTMDGAIVADYITAGTLAANLIKTGIIQSLNEITYFDLDNGIIKLGYDDDTNGHKYAKITPDGIQWMGGQTSGGESAQGVIKNGLTTSTAGDTCVIGADTRYQKYGWYHGGNFQGITVEQVDNEVMVSGKLSVNQAVSCRTLKAWDAKERVVRTPLGNLQMNAMESPEPLFWDVGSGVCDSTGVCWIALRPEYAETISRRAALRWVVTPTGGAGNLWVEKLDSGALVHGGSGQRFDWMCAGVQRGFEGCYAEGDPGRYPVPENPGDWILTAAMDEAAVDLPLTI